MTRWRVIELQPGDVVPPRVVLGLELVAGAGAGVDVELVERAASAAGVTLHRLTDDEGGTAHGSCTR